MDLHPGDRTDRSTVAPRTIAPAHTIEYSTCVPHHAAEMNRAEPSAGPKVWIGHQSL